MILRSDFREGKLTMTLSGELDHHAASDAMRELGGKIDSYLPRDCVLDLKNLKFMDSSGIALILKTYRRMSELEGRLRIENVPPQPMRVLDASGLERIIDIRESSL